MAVYKNKASQKLPVFAVDSTGAPKTGDAANITAKISKDGGSCATSDDANPTELDATNAPGVYLFDLLQAETNADLIVFTAKSSTSGVTLRPVIVYTEPELRSLAADQAVNVTKVNGTSQTARDLGAQLDAAVSTRLASASYASPLDAAGTRSALGLASANLDTQLSGVAAAVWAYSTRTLSAFGTLTTDTATAVWAAGTRTLSSFGTLTTDTATAVWAAGTRTLSSFGTLVADVWANATRTLSAFAFTVATNSDSNVTAIKAKTDNLPAAPAATGDIPSASTIAAAVWAYVVEGSYTAVQYLRGLASSAFGKTTGAATTTFTIRDVADTKDRVVATVDADGNRTPTSLTLT